MEIDRQKDRLLITRWMRRVGNILKVEKIGKTREYKAEGERWEKHCHGRAQTNRE